MITHYRDCEMKQLASLFKERFSNEKVLDIGCGTGRNVPLMKDAGCIVTGVDRNPEQLRGFEEIAVHDDNWQPEPESFDVILASHVIEHLEPAQLCVFMDKWLAALKTGGSLIVLTPVLGERFYYDFTHVRPYYPQSLRMMFGGIETAKSMGSKWKMELQDIWFFRDPFRWRMTRGFYPPSSTDAAAKKMVSITNRILTSLYKATHGWIGRIASWLGIYKKIAG